MREKKQVDLARVGLERIWCRFCTSTTYPPNSLYNSAKDEKTGYNCDLLNPGVGLSTEKPYPSLYPCSKLDALLCPRLQG